MTHQPPHIINKDEIVYDSFGNEIKIEKQVQLSDKDKKKELKSLQKQLKDGKKRKILTDDEIYDLEEKIEAVYKSLTEKPTEQLLFNTFLKLDLFNSTVSDKLNILNNSTLSSPYFRAFLILSKLSLIINVLNSSFDANFFKSELSL